MPSDNQIYATSFCNQGHYLKTGRPVDHECYILPPAMLEAERAGNTLEADRILHAALSKGRTTVRGRRAPKPIKYHKAHGLYTTKLQDAAGDRPEIFDVWFDGGDAALPYGIIEKFKNKPLYHVYVYDPAHAANFTFARTLDYVYSKDDAFKALRKAKYNEVF